jgi:hypothetical protein
MRTNSNPDPAENKRSDFSTSDFNDGSDVPQTSKSSARTELATNDFAGANEEPKVTKNAGLKSPKAELSTEDYADDGANKEPVKKKNCELEEKEKLMQQMQRQEMERLEEWEQKLLSKEREIERQQQRMEKRAREKEIDDQRGRERQWEEQQTEQAARQTKAGVQPIGQAANGLTAAKPVVHRRMTSRERGLSKAKFVVIKPEMNEDVVLSFPMSYTPIDDLRHKERWFATTRFQDGGRMTHLGTFTSEQDAKRVYMSVERSDEQDAGKFVRKASKFEDDYVVTMLGLVKQKAMPAKVLHLETLLVDEMEQDIVRMHSMSTRARRAPTHCCCTLDSALFNSLLLYT